MPLAAPITISQQAIAIKTKLDAWAKPKGGRCEVMANQSHLWEQLVDLPLPGKVAPKIFVLYAGETTLLPDQPDCHRVDRRWQIIVVRGHGFKDPMSGDKAEPFSDSLEAVRDIVRAMAGISDYEFFPSVQYKGTRPLPNVLNTREANAFMDAMVQEYATMNDIPRVNHPS